jgi:hypothetical protein
MTKFEPGERDDEEKRRRQSQSFPSSSSPWPRRSTDPGGVENPCLALGEASVVLLLGTRRSASAFSNAFLVECASSPTDYYVESLLSFVFDVDTELDIRRFDFSLSLMLFPLKWWLSSVTSTHRHKEASQQSRNPWLC